MSRIDEALRRSGVPVGEAPSAVANADLFVSPWALPDLDSADPLARLPVERPADGRDRSGKRSLLVKPPKAKAFETGWRERLAISSEADPLLLNQFRRLVATLLRVQANGPLKTVMIASAAPGDGKTLTSLNLALVLSESYKRRVLLIEGDLRRPAICTAAGLPASGEGLSDAIRDSADGKVSLVRLTDSLSLMPAGRVDADPLSGLTSSRLEHLIREASEQFDWVIIDTPPLGAAPDASLIAPLVDAVLLVVRAGQTPHAVVERAVETLGRDRILGVVLNAVSPDEAPIATTYDHY